MNLLLVNKPEHCRPKGKHYIESYLIVHVIVCVCIKPTVISFFSIKQLHPVLLLCMCVLSCSSHVLLCESIDCSLPGSSVHRDSLGKILEWRGDSLLQGIFPTRESNPGLLHCRQILYHLSHQRSPCYNCVCVCVCVCLCLCLYSIIVWFWYLYSIHFSY